MTRRMWIFFMKIWPRADFQLLKRVVLDGCTMLEAAKEYGISVEACKKRIQRLRTHLKKKLSDL